MNTWISPLVGSAFNCHWVESNPNLCNMWFCVDKISLFHFVSSNNRSNCFCINSFLVFFNRFRSFFNWKIRAFLFCLLLAADILFWPRLLISLHKTKSSAVRLYFPTNWSKDTWRTSSEVKGKLYNRSQWSSLVFFLLTYVFRMNGKMSFHF